MITWVSGFIFAQTQQTIYYDKDWKVVSSKSKAEYYRLVTLDTYGKPQGIVKDYYITGELQWEGIMSYIDKYDNKNDISEGLSTWYYKNGKKSRQSTMKGDKEIGTTTYWYENGNIARTCVYNDNGELNGEYIDYYENGKLKFKGTFSNGNPTDKWFIECDEFEKCNKIFYENFVDNHNEWTIDNNDTYKSEIYLSDNLRIISKVKDQSFANWIHLPIDIKENFSIETIIKFVKGDQNSGHGLIYGFKDWQNYFYFLISGNGYYTIMAKVDGLDIPIVKWTFDKNINTGYERNMIKINKISDKVYFSINGQIIHSDDFYPFKGNVLGFYNLSGEKELLYENLIVRNDISTPILSNTNYGINDWKGNGTGFVITKTGFIVTNYHVIENANDIEVDIIQNGIKKSYKAKVIQVDKQNDLAVIQINDSQFSSFLDIPYGTKLNISDVGSNIFTLGFPMALNVLGTEIKFTDGKISSKTGYQGDITTYQISVPVQPGNSGGPLFDYDGNLIGIVNAKIMAADNVSYAIKSNYLKNLVDVLSEPVQLPNNNLLLNKTLTEKIKVLSEFVVLIKVK